MNGKLKVVVQEISDETAVIKRFKLTPTTGNLLPMFSGGAHIATQLEYQQQFVERNYSLISSPFETSYYEIAIRKADNSSGGSVLWHNHVKVGDIVEISYPKNHFPLSFQAKHHVFFAAGIGITPFLSMMAELKEKGKTFELHYAAHSAEQCAFYNYLNTVYPTQTNFYFSEEGKRMTRKLLGKQKIGTHVYFCGPSTMIKEFQKFAITSGYNIKNVHYELFQAPQEGEKNEFTVVLKSGQTLQVTKDMTLLDALLKNNIKAPYSCKVGGCGSCQVKVLEGEVDHRDTFQSNREKKESSVILTCVSRANSQHLLLDL